MDDMQAPASAEMEPVAEAPEQAPEAESPEPKAEPKPEKAEKPKSEAEKRRSSIEKAMKAVEDDEAKPANGSQSTPKADDADDADDRAEKPDAKAKEAPKEAVKDAQKAPETAKSEQKAPKAAEGTREPPARFSPDAKAAWKDAPEPVKAEVHRAVKELERGLQQKDATLKPLEPFLKMAQQQRVNPAQVVQNYVQMEQTLRQNPTVGLQMLAQNMGMTPQQLAQAAIGQRPGQPDPRDAQIMQLRQQVQQMQQQFGQVSQTVQEQRHGAVLNQIQQFAADKPRFDELAPEIARLIETGYAQNLQDAYEKAARLNPAPAEPAQAAAPSAPAQTRPARSVTGAPSGGSNPHTRKPSANRTEAIQRAMRTAGLA